jgi:hypothetical protein
MFSRHNITSMDDKLEALKRAQIYAQSRIAVEGNVAPFKPNGQRNEHTSRRESRKASPIAANLVAVQGFEGRTPLLTGANRQHTRLRDRRRETHVIRSVSDFAGLLSVSPFRVQPLAQRGARRSPIWQRYEHTADERAMIGPR